MSCSNITGVLQRDRTNKSLRELKARKKLYKINFLHLKKRGEKKKKDAIWCGNSSYNISYLTLPLKWPQPWPAGTLSLGMRGMLLHVISLQGPCWAATAKWTQLSVSCDVDYCLLGRVDTSKHISFS